MKTKIKSQNGVTLVALTVYILIFIVVIGILTTISNFFYGGVGAAMNTPDYVATDFLQCTFTASTFTVDSITKNIINVNFQIGNDIEDSISDNIDFTLRYW